MSSMTSRRQFLQRAAGAAAALPLASTYLRAAGANERLNVAAVGVAGRGGADLTAVAASPHVNIVAICDVDESADHLGKGAKQFPKARCYTDWRRLLDHAREFDALTVGIPDHMHCPVALAAMHLGKHVYCEKPLAHTLFEVRQLREAAEKYRLATQMGNQQQSHPHYQMSVQLVHAGAIGKVKEVHSWQSGKMRWLLTDQRPDGSDPVPPSVHWDDWLGAAPPRPYKGQIYHPHNWRAWKDFSNGQLGDFGCHILDPVFLALQLTSPQTLRAETAPMSREVWPRWSKVHYVFPGTERTSGATLPLTWYDGEGRFPSRAALGLPDGYRLPQAGSVLLGEKGTLVIPHSSPAPKLFPEDRFADYPYPKPAARNHHFTWVDACRGGAPSTSPFTYAGPLTETVLLGTVAMRVPMETLAWNTADLRINNSAPAQGLVSKPYRKGWEPAWL
jgi:predicted dehydrogenase